jgi:nonribosomal peptide synthetase DhbF
VYVLDERLRPVPVGVAGELCVESIGLPHGYCRQPALSAERFIANPFGRQPGARLYRTGDVVRYLRNGTLEYLGRADFAVKIRGHRIDVRQVEKVLGEHPELAQCVVKACQAEPSQQLVAYYTLRGGTLREGTLRGELQVNTEALRGYLTERLPAYMVPALYVELESLPRLPNGKLDRLGLPAPEFTSTSHRAPSTPQEEILATLFAEVLGLERIGIEDSFFQLGGHSLLTTRLIGRIRETMGVEVEIRTLFEAPTVAQLVERLDGNISTNSCAVMLPIQTRGARPPVFCIHPVFGYSWFYARLVRQFGSNYPIYGLQARGLDGVEPPACSIGEMVDDYLNEIRKVQPTGPYHLIGYSFGGIVAHAIAAKLQSQAEEVALLAILDGYPVKPLEVAPLPTESQALWLFLEGGTDAPPPEGDFDAYLARVVRYLRDRRDAFSIFNEKAFVDMIKVLRNNIALLRGFLSPVFAGHLLLFRATDTDGAMVPPISAWNPHVCGPMEIHDIACHHKSMIEERALAVIAAVIFDKLSALYPDREAVRRPVQRRRVQPLLPTAEEERLR